MCYSNPKNLSTIDLYTTCGYSLFTHCIFDTTKNKVHYHRGKDCMKNFCKDLEKHETEIINVEKKGMMQKNNHISSKKFVIYVKRPLLLILIIVVKLSLWNIVESEVIAITWTIISAVHNICNLKYKTPKKIPVVFHNGSIYYYHFIIKELAEDFKA